MSIEKVRTAPEPMDAVDEVLVTLRDGGIKEFKPPRVHLRVPADDQEFLDKLGRYINRDRYALQVRPRGATGNGRDTPRDKATWFAVYFNEKKEEVKNE